MRFPKIRTWLETLREHGASISPRRGRRVIPGLEVMEGRASLSALPAVQGAIPAFNPQPDPPTRWQPTQVSREASLGVMTATAV